MRARPWVGDATPRVRQLPSVQDPIPATKYERSVQLDCSKQHSAPHFSRCSELDCTVSRFQERQPSTCVARDPLSPTEQQNPALRDSHRTLDNSKSRERASGP